MTKVVFETATLADAIKKASQVAPSRGQAFDKAAGIVIEVDPTQLFPVTIKATDTDVYYMEWVDCVSAEGEKATWRLPSKVFAGFVTNLPIANGKQVTVEDILVKEMTMLRLTQDRKVTKFNLMDHEYYPRWDVFDPDALTPVPDIGGKLMMVDWCSAKDDEGVLSGVHMDGKHAIATDKYRFARVPLDIAHIGEPVTVPASVLTQIMKRTGEVKMAIVNGQLQVMPDPTTQIRATLFDQQYPPLDRVLKFDQPDSITFRKSPLLESVRLAMNFVGSNRTPLLQLFVGQESIAIFMEGADTGSMGDVIEIPGQATHQRIQLRFTPKNLTEALDSAPNDDVTLHYDQSTPGRPVRLDGGSGYDCWIAMRAERKEG